MSKKFDKTAQKVADYLSGLRLSSGNGKEHFINLNNSFAWKSKQIFVTGILLQLFKTRYAYDVDGPFKKTLTGLDSKLDLSAIPFEPPDDSPLLKSNVLSSIFDSFMGEYVGPRSLVELEVHLWALQLFYTKICYLAPLDTETFSRIDLALTMTAYHAGAFIKDLHLSGSREKDRLIKTHRKNKAKYDAQKQKVIEIFHTIRRRDKMGPYTIANHIFERYPSNEKPSRSSIVRWIKAEID